MSGPGFDFLRVAGLGKSKRAEPDKRYAGFNRRMFAATFDSILLLVTTPLVNWLAPIDNSVWQGYNAANVDPVEAQRRVAAAMTDPAFIHSWAHNIAVQMTILCIYSAFFWHFWGATPGKMLLRMRVVDAKTGQPVNDMQILLRLCGYFISGAILGIGFFWIGIDKRRQAWHDKLADTVVIALPWRSAKSSSAIADPSDFREPSAGE